MRDKTPQISAKDGSALAKNPLQDPKVREAIQTSPSTAPALAEIAMEGLGSAGEPGRDAEHLRLRPGSARR